MSANLRRRGALLVLGICLLARPARAIQTPNPAGSTLGAVIRAGGGERDFAALTLVRVLAGANAGDDVAAVIRQVGAPAVKRCVVDVDFMVADASRRVAPARRALPAVENEDGVALARALYTAGMQAPKRSFGVARMIERLTSPSVAAEIRRDLRAHDGPAALVSCDTVIAAFMHAVAVDDGFVGEVR
jgi:hypothetical protein